jgi:hypothetical protein
MKMVYGFDSDDAGAATGALLLYALWRSRDVRRFKITPDVWAQIERFTKAAAKRATTLPRFIEAMKPRLCVGTIHPRWMEAGIQGVIPLGRRADGDFVQVQPTTPPREFLTGVLAAVDHRIVLDLLYRETAWIVLLVRDRLEREKPLESRFSADIIAATTEEEPV